MKKILVAASVFALTSCSLVNSVVPSNAGDLASGVGDGIQLKKQIDECSKLETAVVAYPEEVSIGGAIALNLGNRAGATYIELSPEVEGLDFAALMANFKNSKPSRTGAGPKTDLTTYVNTLGKGLAAFSERPGIDWTFSVLESETPNAFSAPGGYVFITTGMLKKLDNEAQLAAVLSHEIGHITGKHMLKTYQHSKKVACIAASIAGKSGPVVDAAKNAIGGAIPGMTDSVVSEVLRSVNVSVFDPNKLSADFVAWLTDLVGDTVAKSMGPDLEKEADTTGTKLMIFAGYDSKEFEKVLQKLPDGGGFLSEHPATKDRIEVITAARGEFSDFAGVAKAPALGASVGKALK